MSEQAIHALIAKWRKDAEQFVLGSDWRDMLIAHADDLEVAALSQETCPELKTAVDALSALSQETPAPEINMHEPNDIEVMLRTGSAGPKNQRIAADYIAQLRQQAGSPQAPPTCDICGTRLTCAKHPF